MKIRIFFTIKFLSAVFLSTMILCDASYSAEKSLKVSKEHKKISAATLRTIKLPRGYHEGLLFDNGKMWVANGQGKKTWIFDLDKEILQSEIIPIAGFTEGITRISEEEYFVTDWYDKKVYRAKIENGYMVSIESVSVDPAFPAGVLWNGSNLFVITWTRGMGTKFDMLVMDKGMNILDRIAIDTIQEPAHMTWDGKYIWISSWYSSNIYKVDIENWEILEFFRSPVSRATGLAYDGKYLWVTGTYSDLYQLDFNAKDKEAVMAIKMTSSSFKDGDMIPKRYAYVGDNISPALEWSSLPEGTRSVAIICDDPDAPGGDFVHWVIFNIPPSVKGLAEGISKEGAGIEGVRQGVNDFNLRGYDGAAPPSGTHRYIFKIYALDKMLEIDDGAPKPELLKAMKGHVLGQGRITGRFSHSN